MFTQKIESKNAPKAIGPYSCGVKLGDFVYLSGQIPLNPETGEVKGDIEEQTHQVMKNIQALLAEMNLETRHILKTTVFMTDLAEFDRMNAVYATYLSEPYPARSTIQVAALPKNAKVEIECVVIDTLAYEQQVNACSCSSDCHDGCCDDESGCCGCGH